jgi:hypothetical protein
VTSDQEASGKGYLVKGEYAVLFFADIMHDGRNEAMRTPFKATYADLSAKLHPEVFKLGFLPS